MGNDEIKPIDDTFDNVVSTTLSNSTPQIVNATHKGFMHVGGIDLECYVLEDGRRVFNKKGMAKAIGLKSEGGNAFLKTMSRKGIRSELDELLLEKIENPILFNYLRSDPNHAYEADVLVEVCKAVKRAKEAGGLTATQEDLYNQAMSILNAFAKVGVVALIDEATGYQTERSPDALRLLVQQYLEDEKRDLLLKHKPSPFKPFFVALSGFGEGLLGGSIVLLITQLIFVHTRY